MCELAAKSPEPFRKLETQLKEIRPTPIPIRKQLAMTNAQTLENKVWKNMW